MNIALISNLKQLANFLRCDSTFLKAYLDGEIKILERNESLDLSLCKPNTTIIEKLYLRKKNKLHKTYREVYSVHTDTLKNVLKGLSTFLKESHNPSNAVHGYVRGRSIRTNAEAHLAKNYILSVDIEDFFGSITLEMVSQSLSSIGFSSFAVEHLAKLVTINNFLPAGYSTSPIISNIVIHSMDEKLINLGGKDCMYTRYADDLYFSSNIALPTLVNIETIILKNGFNLNPLKTKYMPRGVKQYVTGLTVFDHLIPRVSKKIKKNLRLELYYIEKYGWLNHTLNKVGYAMSEYLTDINIKSQVDSEINSIANRINGWLRFMNSVEPPIARKFIIQYRKLNGSI